MERSGGARVVSKADLLERWQAAVARAKRDVAAALGVDEPVVAVITGGSSVALDDILAQLGGLAEDVDIRRLDVPITAPEAVAEAVRGLADVHLAVITRGGGADVHELDHEAVLGAVAGAAVPVAVAAGHESDRLVLGRVADVSFPTPTAFGAWLRARLEDKRQARVREEAVREVGRTRDLVREVQELSAKNQVLVKQAEGMGAEAEKLRVAQAEADTRLKDLLARSATAEGRNEALARELVELQRVRAELAAAATRRQTEAAESLSRQAALEAEKSVLETLRNSLWDEVKGIRAAHAETERRVNEMAARASGLEGRNESLAQELARVRTARKELEAIASRQQVDVAEANAEVASLRKRLEDVRVPALYRAAPWLLVGAAFALATTAALVVVLLLVRN